jgi:serine/threonine protein kinase
MSSLLLRSQIHETKPDQPLDGRYQIVQILADKPWQQTCLAQDLRRPSQPECIIQYLKTIPELPNYRTIASQLFTSEAAILEQIGKHPQIPQLLACFESDGGFYVVYERVLGHSLNQEMHTGRPQAPEQVAQLLLEVLEPLAFAHHCGIQHGNLKPSNLIRRAADDRLVLVNFHGMKQIQRSLVMAYSLTTRLDRAEMDGYQSAEHLRGLPSLASDVYAAGMIGIQALTGVSPHQFDADPQTGEVLWHHHHPPTGSEIDSGLSTILSWMVHQDVDRRYPSAVEALQAVQECLLATALKSASPVTPLAQAIPASSTEQESAEPVGVAEPMEDDRAPSLTPVESGEDLQDYVFPVVLPKSSQLCRSPIPLEQGQITRQSRQSSSRLAVGVTTALALAVSGYTLVNLPNWADQGDQVLAQATEQFQAGQLQQAIALAQSIPNGSRAYGAAQSAVIRWQQDWQTAAARFQQTEQALQAGRWAEVQQRSKTVPAIPYWQERLNPLIQEAKVEADAEANRLLGRAYQRAMARDFMGALADLEQIPAEASVYARAQEKLQEYKIKRDIRAVFYLQQAFNRAEQGDFATAITFLRRVPRQAPAAAIAQKKLVEYTAKQRLRSQIGLEAPVPSVPPASTPPANIPRNATNLNPGDMLQETMPQASPKAAY